MVLVTKPKKEPAIHHKKRSGSHHKRTKPYAKAYWPYLPLLALAGIAFGFNMLWNQLPSSGGYVLGATSETAVSRQLLQDTNSARNQDQLQALHYNRQLAAAAQAKANDMAARNYWSHTAPDGTQPWYFIDGSGYQYQIAAENLAYGFGTSKAVVQGWLNSPEHRDNLLNASYRDVGFGIVQAEKYQGDKPQTIVVAMYGKPINPSLAVNENEVRNLNDVVKTADSRQLTRLELIAGNALPGSLWILVSVSALAAALFIYRHARFVHRAVVYSEAYIVRHRHIDTVIILVVLAGIVLSRSAGFVG